MIDFTVHKPSSFRLPRIRTFLRRRRWVVVVGVMLATLLVGLVAAQLVYGAQQRVLPLTTLDDESIGGKSKPDITQLLQAEYTETKLSVEVGDKATLTTLAKAGISPDIQRTIDQVTDYPVWQRFVPLSLFKNATKRHEVSSVIDATRFDEFTKAVTPLCLKTAKNAVVVVVDGQLKLTPAQNGTMCSGQDVRATVETIPLRRSAMRVAMTPRIVKPAVTTAMAKQLLAKAQTFSDRSIEIQLLATMTTPDAATIASWLTFVDDPQSDQASVSFSDEAITAYLKQLQAGVYIAPGVTIVQMVDGREVSRAVGANGRGVALAEGVVAIKNQLQLGDGMVTLQTSLLAPTVQYNRIYSKTQSGLQSLLDDLVRQKGDYGISVRQIGGSGWSASARGGASYHPASTYKIFVAYAVLKRVEAGQMSWGDQATSGRSVAACFDAMIVNSDNLCAEWFGSAIGWKTITTMIHAVGVSSATSLYATNGFVATADDEALFLTKLQTGQLLSPGSTTRLLDVMKRQVYRSGIPAGVSGVVADKVGFLNGLLHDAAIVSTPSGTYVVVIMTNGSSWGQIADAARQIDAQLQ